MNKPSFKRNSHRGNLGFGTGLLLLMFSISFALYLFNPCYGTVFFQVAVGGQDACAYNLENTTGVNGSASGLNTQIQTIFTSLGILGLGTIVAGAVGFPNGYAIFAAAGYFLIGAFTMPLGLFTAEIGLPVVVRIFIVTVFSLLNLFAVLENLSAKRF